MANQFLTPQLIAQQALATLYETLVMVPLVYTDISSEFTSQKPGNTINIRKPAVFTANKFQQGSGITLQNAVEGSIPVTLNQVADVSFPVTSQELTTSIINFDEQLLTPACMALAEQIDRDILGLRSTVTQTVGVQGTNGNVADWSKPETLIDAGRVLDIAKVPMDGRSFVTGPTTKSNFLNSTTLKYVMNSGDNEALRKASIGENLFGFDAYQTQNVGQPGNPGVGSGLPTTEVGVAFHETAFCFASAPLELAPGSFASVQTYNGISIRVAYQYDITQKQTIVSLDTLYGVQTLDKNRACLVQGALA